MIHYVNELSTTDELLESMRGSGDNFPFSANEVDGNEYVNNCAKWHWHHFVEFVFVLEGVLECCTPKQVLKLYPGEGYFINTDVLHMNRMAAGSSRVTYRVLQFETRVLGGSETINEKYVMPIQRSAGLEALRLSSESALGRRILGDISAMFDIAAEEPEQYEMHILRHIVDAWLNLYSLAEPHLCSGTQTTDIASARVKVMLAFIHDHCTDAINVDDIANAASISRREAFRCFRQVLNTTPTLYLLQHRINRGARMLVETGKTITEIGFDCGFSSSSYFCKAFHDMTGVSPSVFRQEGGMKKQEGSSNT